MKLKIRKEIKNSNQYKIITLGSSGIGKTSIFQRLSKDKFQENCLEPTVVWEISAPYYIKNKTKYKLFFYDSTGSEKFKTLTQNYLINSDGINMYMI